MSTSTRIRVAVFYHCAHLGTWEAVDAQIMAALTASGLRERADVFVRNDCNDIGLFEFPTLNMLREFARGADYHVLYLHTKGVTQSKPSIDDWRACMIYWMVDRWRECLEKLHSGYSAVGINEIATPRRHYQGNFWWTTTRHLRSRGPIEDVEYVPTCANQLERHKAEFWLLDDDTRAYQPYHHKLNPYSTRNPSRNYVGRRF